MDTINLNLLAMHFQQTLKAGVFYDVPFELTEFEVFPASLYQSILDNLPASEYYKEMPHLPGADRIGPSSRLVFSLKPQNLKHLPSDQKDFWSEFSHCMRSSVIKQVFYAHARKELEIRFGADIGDIPGFCAPMLYRDLQGYELIPHTDTPWKTLTVQAYLPTTPERPHLGTTIYRPTPSGFERVRTLRFIPNNGYLFTVNKDTWHGVQPYQLTTPRDSISLTFYQTHNDEF